MNDRATIVWLRNDLRIRDNPALFESLERGSTCVPVFVWDPASDGAFPPGSASRWFLHHALIALDASLCRLGCSLIVRKGDTCTELTDVARDTGSATLLFNRRYEPAHAHLERDVVASMDSLGVTSRRFDTSILHDVDAVRTTSGSPYQVFTPFWRRVRRDLRVPPPLPEPPPSQSADLPDALPTLEIQDLGLVENAEQAAALAGTWTVTEEAAHARLDKFVESALDTYAHDRDIPYRDGTSRLSPYLHFGMLSPTQIWTAVEQAGDSARPDVERFLSEIGWREFGYHLLHHFPHTTQAPLREAFNDLSWNDDVDALARWKAGQTGYPIVDAGMRQLAKTGWMHNRLRMIVASFLTKDLLIDWREGAAWFWENLVDADLANNTLGWQWAAGTGADAQPFFRIFNPTAQAKRFDPDGAFVRAWVPELQNLPDRYLHRPWEVPGGALDGFVLGRDYPGPIVEHGAARTRALEAYNRIK
jgi:deoxyribodipyrimidine photo-lyase